MSDFMGQPNYTPYSPYIGSQNPYMGGYRTYMPPISYGQNQQLNGQNNMFSDQQRIQQPQQNNNIQFVLIPSIDVAQKATAEKNQTIYMMNQNKPEIYAKASDEFGLQTTRYFKLIEFNPDQENQKNNQNNQQNADYIPREEFNQFVAAVSTEINALKQSAQTVPQHIITTTEPTTIPQNVNTTNSNKKSTATKETKQ